MQPITARWCSLNSKDKDKFQFEELDIAHQSAILDDYGGKYNQ